MGIVLKNERIEIHFDLPHEHYHASRFDWTGKIQQVYFQGIPLSISEKNDPNVDEHLFGKGFYNEFGIDTALGFEEADIGEWFHKIGIGLLRKNESDYFFFKEFEIKPAEFSVSTFSDRIEISAVSKIVNGYAYELNKKIELKNDGFLISYQLTNTGEKEIVTDEYTHNFLTLHKANNNANYSLKFPFSISMELQSGNLNPENVELGDNFLHLKKSPEKEFFYNNLSNSKKVTGKWTLIDNNQKIGISESTDFEVSKINLWGSNHVISPELFHQIHLSPGSTTEWTRNYEIILQSPDNKKGS